MSGNALIVTQLLLSLLERAAEVGRMLGRAQAEGRDITKEELAVARANDDAAREMLEIAIKAARDN
jgi:hypothetical protein